MKSNFTFIDGIRLHYYEYGSPRSPTMLFLHGFHGDAASLESLASFVSKEFRVIVPDLPGFGKSQDYNGEFIFSKVARILSLFMKKNYHGPYYISGVSMGGAIVVEMLKYAFSDCLGIALFQPLYSGNLLILPKYKINLIKILIKLCKRQIIYRFIGKRLYDNDRFVQFLIKNFSASRINDQNELNIRTENIRKCSAKTYFSGLDAILDYKPNFINCFSQKAILIINKNDKVLDSQKTLQNYKLLFPDNRVIHIELDNHNPTKQPDVKEISKMFPELLTTIQSVWGLKVS